MKITIFAIIFTFLFISFVFADELRIPFPCWPKELQEEFAKTERKLDLRDGERTNNSWAFLKNKGSSYVIYTYYSVTPEDFEAIRKITHEIELRKREENE